MVNSLLSTCRYCCLYFCTMQKIKISYPFFKSDFHSANEIKKIHHSQWDRNATRRKLHKVQMKCFFFIAEFERAAKIRKISIYRFLIQKLRNEKEDKMKTQMTQSFNQYSENETKIWQQNILNQFNRVSWSNVFVLIS